MKTKFDHSKYRIQEEKRLAKTLKEFLDKEGYGHAVKFSFQRREIAKFIIRIDDCNKEFNEERKYRRKPLYDGSRWLGADQHTIRR